MAAPYNPDRLCFVADPAVKRAVQQYTLDRGHGLRGQGKALNELLEKALKAEGYPLQEVA